MNESDSERIAGTLIDRGYSMVSTPDDAELVVLNTCSIRDGAENKVYSDLGRLRMLEAERGQPMKIAVAGCVAQQEGARILARDRGVNLVFGSRAISQLGDMLPRLEAGERLVEVDIHTRPDAPDSHVRPDPWRAFVTVMEGCDNHCAFCVVPATRGPEVSRAPEGIVDEVEQLAAAGCVEVTLLGQNVTSYGRGLSCGTDFAGLLERIHAVPGIRRIRYTTSHPKDFSERLMDTLARLPKVARHLHLPLQSGSNRVLERMGRGYTVAEYMRRIERIRALIPDIAVTTDMIVGFPGETGADFEQTLDAVRDIGYLNLYGFKYSRRPNTAALALDGHLDDEVRSARLEKLLTLQKAITLARHQSLVGSLREVLVEGVSRRNAERLSGRLEENLLVHFSGDPDWQGTFRTVRITSATSSALLGEDLGEEDPLETAGLADGKTFELTRGAVR